MKKTRPLPQLLTIGLLLWSTNLSFGECTECEKVLVKDYIKTASSTFHQLTILKTMSKELFEELKNSGGGGGGISLGILDLVSLAINGSGDYEEFKQKREKYFESYSYNLTEQQAQDELRVVTNPIAYEHWSKCIEQCYNNTPGRVYGFIEKADENFIFVKVKYIASPASRQSIKCKLTTLNGGVLKELKANSQKVQYATRLNFEIKKGEEAGFTIKRTQPKEKTLISIDGDGVVVLKEFSRYSPPDNRRNIIGILNVTYLETGEKEVDTKTEKVRSLNLHEIRGDDSECGKRGGFASGKWCYARNTISLPNLSGDLFYKSFSGVRCSVDNEGACGWSASSGLKEIASIGDNKQTASVSFVTGSRDCEWSWSGVVYQKFTYERLDTSPPKSIRSSFVVQVPKKATGAAYILKIGGNEHAIELGKSHPELDIIFINRTDDGTNLNYEYLVK